VIVDVTPDQPGVILDTTVFVATESGRAIHGLDPDLPVAISVVTVAELKAGVLAAADTATRAQRMATVDLARSLPCLPIDEYVADAWVGLRVAVAEGGRRVNINDLWIAATAIRHGLAVATQDGDFDVLAEIADLQVIRV